MVLVEDMHVSVELHSIKQKGWIWVSLASGSVVVKMCVAKQNDLAECATDLVMYNIGLQQLREEMWASKRDSLVTDGA